MTTVLGRGRLRRPALWALLIGLCACLAPEGVARADPAGPTDYRTDVVAVSPPTPAVEVSIIGGDSFVELRVESGTEVRVSGYRAEPYLWFRADGEVLENRNSPTKWDNDERYGAEAPPFATADAEPDWRLVASDGTYAWHDHRAHWMQPIRPAGKSPGDQILDARIPLTVDDAEVDVIVHGFWLPEPSRLPILLGAGLGAIAVIAAVGLRRRSAPWPAVLLPVAALASWVGWRQYTSMPSETGAPLVWWLPAMLALGLAIAATVVWRRDRFVADSAALLSGLMLVWWALAKRDGLGAAIVPTDAPAWLDRAAVAIAFVAGGGAVVLSGTAIFLALAGTRASPAAT